MALKMLRRKISDTVLNLVTPDLVDIISLFLTSGTCTAGPRHVGDEPSLFDPSSKNFQTWKIRGKAHVVFQSGDKMKKRILSEKGTPVVNLLASFWQLKYPYSRRLTA